MLNASAVASKYCDWYPGLNLIYIPHHEYQINLHSSPSFASASAAPMAHENHFFHL